MKWLFIFCACSLALISGCGLFEEWEFDPSKAIEPQLTPNAVSPSQDELMSQIDSLLFSENDCMLPCFGGLYPRESSIGDVEAFVGQFNVDESAVQVRRFEAGGYGLSLFPEPAGLVLIDLLVEDDELSYMTVLISHAHEWLYRTPYDLPNVFSKHGEPDDVFMLVAGPPIGFSLVIPYNEQGFMLRYGATYDDSELASNNEALPVCLEPEIVDLQAIDVWLQNADEAHLVESNQPDLREDREIRPWWDIQRMANVTVAEFVGFFVANQQACFSIPSLAELVEQGYVP